MSEEMVSCDPAPGTCRTFRPAGVDMRFRYIPAGRFRMGQRGMGEQDPWFFNEEPPHDVVIERGFWLGETPVTQTQYAALKIKTPAHKGGNGESLNYRVTDPSHFKGDDRPVENVSWDDANEMCGWFSRNGKEWPEGCSQKEWEFRLPTEAEWEYACRGGTETDYWSGDGEAALAEVGWYGGNAERSTHPVRQKEGNAWGLRDMHGNVWEWCEDVYDGQAYRKREDGWKARAWTVEDVGEDAEYFSDSDRDLKRPLRVLRGGSWFLSAGAAAPPVGTGAGRRSATGSSASVSVWRAGPSAQPVKPARKRRSPGTEAGGAGRAGSRRSGTVPDRTSTWRGSACRSCPRSGRRFFSFFHPNLFHGPQTRHRKPCRHQPSRTHHRLVGMG